MVADWTGRTTVVGPGRVSVCDNGTLYNLFVCVEAILSDQFNSGTCHFPTIYFTAIIRVFPGQEDSPKRRSFKMDSHRNQNSRPLDQSTEATSMQICILDDL